MTGRKHNGDTHGLSTLGSTYKDIERTRRHRLHWEQLVFTNQLGMI